MVEPKKIFCPICNKKVATYDGRTKTPLVTRCEKCEKRIVYNPETGKIEVKKIPPKNTSSGVTYI